MNRGLLTSSLLTVLISTASSATVLSKDNYERLSPLQQVLEDYKDNKALEQHLRDFASAARCGSISRLFSIGKSAQGVELWGLEISSNPGMEEAKPRFKYVGNMHGDEPTGRVLQLAVAEWLCENWQSDARAQQIVEGMKLFLLPTINPDGFASKTRENSNAVDLNRNYPDPMILGLNNLGPQGTEQPETLAIMKWTSDTHFVAGASMHEGAFVANYPWDGSTDGGTHYSACPDDKAFIHLAKSYAKWHTQMNTSRDFQEGITNGAAWYPLWGGMQDWNYLAGDCMELTLELSLNKWPPAAMLPSIWEDNKLALINLPLTAVFGGLRGFVHRKKHGKGDRMGAEDSKNPGKGHLTALQGAISVEGIDHNSTSSKSFGDYYRPLAPGWYNVTASAPLHHPQTEAVRIPEDGSGLIFNFTLDLMQSLIPRLPRKFGAFDGDFETDTSIMTQEEGQELLLSEGMWIRMMQTIVFLLLGGGLGVLLVLALRVLLGRSFVPQQFMRSLLRRSYNA